MSKKISKNEKADESALQEKYIQAQMLEQQLKQLQKYMDSFDEQLVGIRSLIDAIKEFGELKKGERIFAPLTNGVFIKAKLEDSSELLINVGNNVVVNKTIPEAIAMLEAQENELKKYRSETLAQLENLMKQIELLEA